MRKLLLIATILAVTTGVASAQYGTNTRSNTYGSPGTTYGTGSNSSSHSVDPYVTRNGTYVQPHQQTNPNSTKTDNYGAKGNVNPYTGQVGRGY
jgi:hypothetical protein